MADPQRPDSLQRLARWCFTHRRYVLLAWLALAVGTTGCSAWSWPAVLLDAPIVRSILTPALMLAIGERQWSLPSA